MVLILTRKDIHNQVVQAAYSFLLQVRCRCCFPGCDGKQTEQRFFKSTVDARWPIGKQSGVVQVLDGTNAVFIDDVGQLQF